MTNGVGQIVRFNWPFYAIGAAAVLVAAQTIPRLPIGPAWHAILFVPPGLAVLWIVASLTSSWIVYDVSPLMRWTWIGRALGTAPRTWINIHAGLDQSTPTLQAMFPGSAGRVFDIFDPRLMTEPSIARARRLAHNAVEAEPVSFAELPAASGSADAVFLLLSAHELRTDEARNVLFDEVGRVLARGGRVIVAEHLRDAANFAAFGPGFLHFHSKRTWMRCFARTGFTVDTAFPMTPFVRVFALRRGR